DPVRARIRREGRRPGDRSRPVADPGDAGQVAAGLRHSRSRPILVTMSGRTFVPPTPSAQETLASRGVTLVPSTRDERATLLDQTEWSRRFSWQQLECFAIYLHRYQLETGRVLFREGDHDAFVAIVLAGQLAIRKNDLAEQTRVVATVGKGKLVGEMSLL